MKDQKTSKKPPISGRKKPPSQKPSPTSIDRAGGPVARPSSKSVGAPKKKPGLRDTTVGRQDAGIAGVAVGVTGAAAVTAAAAGALTEETRAKLDRLQRDFGSLQESKLLTSVHNEMADIHSTLSLLPTEIEELRTRGYVFRSFLEKVQVLTEQWQEMNDRVAREVSKRVQELERNSDTTESALHQAMSGNTAQISRAESAINTFESKVRAARSAVEAMYAPLKQNVNQTNRQVQEIRQLLEQIDEASFQLLPAECPIAACKARLMEREAEGPEGLLFLTDERILFEQKEEVATKKVLFITTQKETVQEFIFAIPIGQVEEAKASDKKKFLGRKEMLELLFAPGADLRSATLRLLGAENEEWVRLIGRVKSGEIDKERTQPKDEAVVEAAQAAPTKCPTCGATLAVEIVRGMREITCDYCGSIIRL
ncbi:MAG TPA: hypothetical protein ENN99_15530 [Chloroflexi bacterium]|nr:hypothetical protein [Chloroflexota bacterium]